MPSANSTSRPPSTRILVAVCCGASTFAHDMLGILARGCLFSPGKELTKENNLRASVMTHLHTNYTTPLVAFQQFESLAASRGDQALFFTAILTDDSVVLGAPTLSLKAKEKLPHLFLDPLMTPALSAIRPYAVWAHRNVLDMALCRVLDCFGFGNDVEAVFLNGTTSGLCFARRFSDVRLYVRIKDFEGFAQRLQRVVDIWAEIPTALTSLGISRDNHVSSVAVEELAGFQYEATPGNYTARAVMAWKTVMTGLNIPVTESTIKGLMVEMTATHGVRVDELYSERIWAPSGENGLQTSVTQLVEKFGYRRSPESLLVDWSIPQTEKLARSMPRHHLNKGQGMNTRM